MAYAQEISHRMMWPLLYLGKPIGGGKHEPNPSLWDCATATSKSQTIVCYEWLHITVGPQKKRHIVPMIVNHALHHHRPPPRWPL
jgi:hypothetical protein